MPLNVRSNGSTSSNIITASWFNDIRDLLTAVMQDQEVAVKNTLTLQAISAAPATAPTAALAAGTNLGIGLYVYTVTFANNSGETNAGPTVSITTTSGNQKVTLSAIPTGPTGTIKRNIYRTKVGGGTGYLFNGSIGDNTTTTYTDTIADASLQWAVPTSNYFGGSLTLKDASGNVTARLNEDGSLFSSPSALVVTGSVSGTATLWQPFQGNPKLVLVFLNNFKDASGKSFAIPAPFIHGAFVWAGAVGAGPTTGGISFNQDGTFRNISIFTGLAANGGSITAQTNLYQYSFGDIPSSFNNFIINGNTGSAVTGHIIVLGS